VIARHAGALVRAGAVAHRDDLRGARLAATTTSGRRAFFPVPRSDMTTSRMASRTIARFFGETSDWPRTSGWISRPHGPVRCVDALHVVRPVAGATVRDGGRHVRHLQRRRRDVALPDRDRERLAGIPWLLEAPHLPGRVRNGAGLLMLELHAGHEAEAEAPRVLRDAVDREPRPVLVEEDVARLDDGLVQAHVAVPALPPAAEVMIAELRPPRAARARRDRRRARLERARGDRHFERRARGVLALDGAVVERPQGSCRSPRHSSRRTPRAKTFGS
jgi:hypothetical protein